MSINLLELVQQKLGYPALQKIDANTQEVILDPTTPDEHRFSQAAIPTVLTGLATFTKLDENIEVITNKTDAQSLLSYIFTDKKYEVVNKVAEYAFYSDANAEIKMNEIANAAVEIMNEKLSPEKSRQDVRNFFEEQKIIVLKYLPATLKLGEILKNDTLDDQTHKMEGPISNLMHKLENAFSTTDEKNKSNN
jgi:hypothetical protein